MDEEKNFCVSVSETNYGSVKLVARNKDEAEERALELYNEGNFYWKDTSLSEFTVEED